MATDGPVGHDCDPAEIETILRRIITCDDPPMHMHAPEPNPLVTFVLAAAMRWRWTRALLTLVAAALSKPARFVWMDRACRLSRIERYRTDGYWRRWLETGPAPFQDVARILEDRLEVSLPARQIDGLRAGDLVVLGPGVDQRILDQLDWPEQPIEVLDLSGGRRTVFEGRFQLRGIGLSGRSLVEQWYDEARRISETVVKSFSPCFGPDDRTGFRTHKALVAIQLKHIIAPLIRAARVLMNELQVRPPERVILVEGEMPADGLRAVCLAAGVRPDRLKVLSFGRPVATRRRKSRDQVQAGEGMTGPVQDTAPAVAALKVGQSRIRPLVAFQDWQAATILGIDLRNPRDFRHHAPALTILGAVAEHEPTVALLTYTHFNRPLYSAIRVARRTMGRNGHVALLREPHIAGLKLGAQARLWRNPLLATVSRQLDGDGTVPRWLRPVILEGTGILLAGRVPAILAALASLTRRLASSRGTIAVPAGRALQSILSSAARAAACPSLDVITLMIGESERDNPPLARDVAVIDTYQRDLVIRRFGIAAGHVHPVGLYKADVYSDEAGSPLDAGARPRRVRYFSQPLGAVAIETFDALLAAVERANQEHPFELVVHPHPDEGERMRGYFQERLQHCACQSTLADKPVRLSELENCDLVITMASNVALKAAVLGRPIIVVDLRHSLPIRFDAYGLAEAATDPEGLAGLIKALLTNKQAIEALRIRQSAYFEANPQMLEGDYGTSVWRAFEKSERDYRLQP